MAATYTFDVFSSLDGFGAAGGDWTGYWGKQGPELLDHRLARYGEEQRMAFGANTYRVFAQMLASSTEESEVRDPWVTWMRNLPATVVSTTLEAPLDWPDATVVSGDAVDIIARLKEESDVPLRSHGSLSLNRALMAAGLVDRVQVTLFPVITRPKYVASTTLTDPQWANTTVLAGDVAGAIGGLRAEPGGELQVWGSGTLIRWLLDQRLVDEIVLITYPVVVGQGTRLFPATGPDIGLELVGLQSTPKGLTIQTYRTTGRPQYETATT